MSYVPRLRAKYKNEVAPALQKEFGYTSSMQVPRISKISLNQGLGSAVGDKKIVENAIVEMTSIAGQKAVQTSPARTSATSNCGRACPSAHG
jgi:large subunit ribosomal protein L5